MTKIITVSLTPIACAASTKYLSFKLMGLARNTRITPQGDDERIAALSVHRAEAIAIARRRDGNAKPSVMRMMTSSSQPPLPAKARGTGLTAINPPMGIIKAGRARDYGSQYRAKFVCSKPCSAKEEAGCSTRFSLASRKGDLMQKSP
jgi:hypothetical protein